MIEFIRKILNLNYQRKSRRHKIDFDIEILLFIEKIGFKLIDISQHGLSFQKNQNQSIQMKKYYFAELEIFGRENCRIKIQPVRIQNDIVGCKVEESHEYDEFLDELRALMLNKNQAQARL